MFFNLTTRQGKRIIIDLSQAIVEGEKNGCSIWTFPAGVQEKRILIAEVNDSFGHIWSILSAHQKAHFSYE